MSELSLDDLVAQKKKHIYLFNKYRYYDHHMHSTITVNNKKKQPHYTIDEMNKNNNNKNSKKNFIQHQ